MKRRLAETALFALCLAAVFLAVPALCGLLI